MCNFLSFFQNKRGYWVKYMQIPPHFRVKGWPLTFEWVNSSSLTGCWRTETDGCVKQRTGIRQSSKRTSLCRTSLCPNQPYCLTLELRIDLVRRRVSAHWTEVLTPHGHKFDKSCCAQLCVCQHACRGLWDWRQETLTFTVTVKVLGKMAASASLPWNCTRHNVWDSLMFSHEPLIVRSSA